MPQLPIKIPEMHPGQQQVWQESREFLAANKNQGYFFLCAHRDWWKSSLALQVIWHGISRQFPVAYYAFTQDPIDNFVNDMLFKAFGRETILQHLHQTDQILRLPGLGPLHFYSLEKASHAAGPTFPIVVNDEAGQTKEGDRDAILFPIVEKGYRAYGWGEFWDFGTVNRTGNPKNDFYTVIESTRIGRRHGRAWVIPIPGKVDESDQLSEQASPLANPQYPYEWAQKEYAARTRKKEFRIEYLCEFIADEGSQFANIESVCRLPYTEDPTTGLCLAHAPGTGPFQTGVDIGISLDYTVLTVMDMATNQMVAFWRFLPGTWEPFYQAVLKIAKLFPGLIRIDATGGGRSVPETFVNRGLYVEGVEFNVQNKPAILDHMAHLISTESVVYFDHPDIRFELNMMQRTPRKNGGFDISAKRGTHDDIPISLGLSNYGLLAKVASSGMMMETRLLCPSVYTRNMLW